MDEVAVGGSGFILMTSRFILGAPGLHIMIFTTFRACSTQALNVGKENRAWHQTFTCVKFYPLNMYNRNLQDVLRLVEHTVAVCGTCCGLWCRSYPAQTPITSS